MHAAQYPRRGRAQVPREPGWPGTLVAMGRRWKVATIRGIPLFVGSSWMLLAVIYVWAQYVGLTQGFARETPATAIVLAVFTGVLFFGSVLLHEAAHAVTARALDLPVSGITLVFWGGATETRANARGPFGEFLVAFVGPFTTLVMSGVFWVAAQITHGTVHSIFDYLAFLSLLFAAMNTLPGFPLDGGRMLLAAVWGITRSRRTALRTAGYVGIAMGLGLFAFAAYRFAQNDTFLAIFCGYLGFIMLATGRGMDGRIAFRDNLAKGTAADVMRPPPTTVPADMTLTDALDHALRGGTPDQRFPVTEADGRLIGTVSMDSARPVGARDPMRPVRDAMIPMTQTPLFTPQETLEEVLEWLAGREGFVLEGGRLVGAIGPADVERWYRREMPEGWKGDLSDEPTGLSMPPRPDV